MSNQDIQNVLSSAPAYGLLLAIFFAIMLLASKKDRRARSTKK